MREHVDPLALRGCVRRRGGGSAKELKGGDSVSGVKVVQWKK